MTRQRSGGCQRGFGRERGRLGAIGMIRMRFWGIPLGLGFWVMYMFFYVFLDVWGFGVSRAQGVWAVPGAAWFCFSGWPPQTRLTCGILRFMRFF